MAAGSEILNRDLSTLNFRMNVRAVPPLVAVDSNVATVADAAIELAMVGGPDFVPNSSWNPLFLTFRLGSTGSNWWSKSKRSNDSVERQRGTIWSDDSDNQERLN